MSWDKTEGGDFGHSGGTSRAETFIRGLNIELANERNLRAKAEAENERLKLMVKSITSGLDEAIETVHFLETENAKLRAVVEAAREYMTVFDETPGYYESLDECVRLKEVLRQALTELDEEGTTND